MSAMIASNLCWRDFRTPKNAVADNQPCLFLDRDGVLVEEVQYLHTAEQTKMISGAVVTLAAAKAAGWLCGLVTNQSGIGRGYYDWQDFEKVQSEIDRHLSEAGVRLDFVLACPFHRDAKIEKYQYTAHPWRKPNPGMILEVLDYYRAAPEKSVMVGDTVSDVEAAQAANLGRFVHVLTGHGKSERTKLIANGKRVGDVTFCESIADRKVRALFGVA